MWSLGKVLPAPEVPKIHIGSFWDQPLQNEESRKLFEAEVGVRGGHAVSMINAHSKSVCMHTGSVYVHSGSV